MNELFVHSALWMVFKHVSLSFCHFSSKPLCLLLKFLDPPGYQFLHYYYSPSSLFSNHQPEWSLKSAPHCSWDKVTSFHFLKETVLGSVSCLFLKLQFTTLSIVCLLCQHWSLLSLVCNEDKGHASCTGAEDLPTLKK